MEEYIKNKYFQLSGKVLDINWSKDPIKYLQQEIHYFKSFVSIVKEYCEYKGDPVEIQSYQTKDQSYQSQLIIKKEIKSVATSGNKQISRELACEQYIFNSLNSQKKQLESVSPRDQVVQDNEFHISKLENFNPQTNYRSMIVEQRLRLRAQNPCYRFFTKPGVNSAVQCMFMGFTEEGTGTTKENAKNMAAFKALTKVFQSELSKKNLENNKMEQEDDEKSSKQKKQKIVKNNQQPQKEASIKKKIKTNEEGNKKLDDSLILVNKSFKNQNNSDDSDSEEISKQEEKEQIILLDKQTIQQEGRSKTLSSARSRSSRSRSQKKKRTLSIKINKPLNEITRMNSEELNESTISHKEKDSRKPNSKKIKEKKVIEPEEDCEEIIEIEQKPTKGKNPPQKQQHQNVVTIDLEDIEEDNDNSSYSFDRDLVRVDEEDMKETKENQSLNSKKPTQIKEKSTQIKEKSQVENKLRDQKSKTSEVDKSVEIQVFKPDENTFYKYIDQNLFKYRYFPNNSLSTQLFEYMSIHSAKQTVYEELANVIDLIELSIKEFQNLGMICLKIVGSLFYKILSQESIVGDIVLVFDNKKTLMTDTQIRSKIKQKMVSVFKGKQVQQFFNYISIKDYKNEIKIFVEILQNEHLSLELHHWFYMKNYHFTILENQAIKSIFIALRRLRSYYQVKINICVLDALVVWATKQFQYINPQQNIIDILQWITFFDNISESTKYLPDTQFIEIHKQLISEHIKELKDLSVIVKNILLQNSFDFLVAEN